MAEMADEDLLATLQSELDSLRHRVKELEIENAKLVSLLSSCRCSQITEKIDNGARSDAVSSEQRERLNTKGRRTRKINMQGHYLRTMHHYPKRYVALKVMYFGKRFYGFASEAHMEPTVESELFKALERTRLLIGDKELSKYSRCGRTDKGVSAVGQVICLYLRSNLKKNSDNNKSSAEGEIDYVRVLNNVLPEDIRIMGWCPAPVDFHARFTCLSREYKYFFWRENLDLSAMETAGKKFLGEHDFRNFCKMDALNVHNYKRHVMSFEITPCPERFESKELWAIKIQGSAFLWHQVRCMVSVLFMIGKGLETVNVIDALLDIERTPRKPQYTMAPEIPLVLQSCEFDSLQFSTSPDAWRDLHMHLETECQSYVLQSAIFHEALHKISPVEVGLKHHSLTTVWCALPHFLPTPSIKKSVFKFSGGRSPNNARTRRKASHVPLMARATEPSYEERCSKFNPRSLNQELVALSLEAETK